MNEDERAVPFTLWKKSGVTEHLGGQEATQHLIDGCSRVAGEYVLDAGCGTGHTATYLAEKYQVTAVGLDLMPEAVRATRRRADATDLTNTILPVQGDVASLPFTTGSFDCVFAESLLVFCSAPHVAAEFRRVLRPGGRLGVNELTLLAPAAYSLQTLLARHRRVQAKLVRLTRLSRSNIHIKGTTVAVI
jgi:ubiquinone/menaquinone biosynthesis C-methylase UbiE